MKQPRTFGRLLILLVFLLIICEGFSQTGNPYLSHYRLPDGVSNQNWGFAQGQNGLMYILNRKGIYSFDGAQWENLGIAGRPISIAYSNHLFYCTEKGVGYFQLTPEGSYSQLLLLESSENNFFYKFNKIPNGLLVISPSTICKITTDPTISIDTLYSDKRPQVFISDFFEINKNLYHVKNRALIYLNKPDGEFEMVAGLPLGVDMTFSFIHNENVYFGASDSKLYRFDGKKLSPYSIKDQAYLNASVPNEGLSIDQNQFALSTLNGGCLIINSKDGTTDYTMNFLNGIPDDEIYSMGLDNDGGLWLSHGMGISRVDLKIPVKSYSYYPGLRGNILSSTEFMGKLYVGTNEGLYILDEIRDYKAVSIAVKKKTPAKTITTPPSEPVKQKEEVTVEEKKKGFLSRIFNRRSQKVDETTEIGQTTLNTTPTVDQRDLTPQRKTIYQLQSVRHSFSKVSGLQGKVRQLVKHNGRLYAATNFGLYEIENNRVSQVVEDLNITHIAISSDHKDNLLIGADNGAFIATLVKTKWKITPIIEGDNHLIVSLIQLSADEFLITDEFDVLLAKKTSAKDFTIENIPIPGAESGNPIVRWVNGKAMVFSANEAYLFDNETKVLTSDREFSTSNFSSIIFNQPNYTWFKESGVWRYQSATSETFNLDANLINLLDNPHYINIENDSIVLVVNQYSQVYKITTSKTDSTKSELSIFFKGVKDKEGKLLNRDNIELSYSNNSLKIRISAPSFIREGSAAFQYNISGLMESWTEWNSSPNIELPFLPPGKYTISLRAKDLLGNTSNTIDLSVVIKSPFWQTTWFYAICLVIVILLFILTVKVRERSLQKEKEILEQKVKERTLTIEEQKGVLKKQRDDLEVYNKEILFQKDEIEAQRDEIEAQRDHIFKQNEEITQSIAYARRIQSAVMPSHEVIKSLLDDYFILFRPRDIVSGDFFWMTEKDNYIIIAAADCTGHGVPGAFMSMMGVSLLNDIVNGEGIIQPNMILESLRRKIIATLWQTGKEGEARDGMDMAICVYQKDMKRVIFTGAYNPLYLVRNDELIEYKPDKMPVGVHPKQEMAFTQHVIDLLPGDSLYIFSDGFVDQFGGPDGRKFMAKPFKALLTSMHGKPMVDQKLLLEDALDKWQAHHDQVDDVLVIGVKIE